MLVCPPPCHSLFHYLFIFWFISFHSHIDCAPVYLNEKTIGKVLKEWIDAGKVKREDLFITTKLPDYGEWLKLKCAKFVFKFIKFASVLHLGNRAESVEKHLKKSLADLNLTYVDLYLIHVPFGFPESDTGPQRHPNGDVILDLATDHVAVWKVCTALSQQRVFTKTCRKN